MLGLLLALGLARAAGEGELPSGTPPGTAAPQTVAQWVTAYGPPSRSLALSERTRSAEEPLLVYWMQVQAAPLGLGPTLPGTLVANFRAASPLEAGTVQDLTFLAGGEAAQVAALEAAVRAAGWVRAERVQERTGGRFRDLELALPDGRSGTLSLRQEGPRGGMADGRPSPALWLYLASDQPAGTR